MTDKKLEHMYDMVSYLYQKDKERSDLSEYSFRQSQEISDLRKHIQNLQTVQMEYNDLIKLAKYWLKILRDEKFYASHLARTESELRIIENLEK